MISRKTSEVPFSHVFLWTLAARCLQHHAHTHMHDANAGIKWVVAHHSNIALSDVCVILLFRSNGGTSRAGVTSGSPSKTLQRAAVCWHSDTVDRCAAAAAPPLLFLEVCHVLTWLQSNCVVFIKSSLHVDVWKGELCCNRISAAFLNITHSTSHQCSCEPWLLSPPIYAPFCFSINQLIVRSNVKNANHNFPEWKH